MNWISEHRYRVIKPLSGGNMSKVYLGIDYGSKDEKEVVIKSYPLGENRDFQKNLFYREVENLERLNHKNIVKIENKGIDEKNNLNFIVLEYLRGQSLDKIIFKDILPDSEKHKIILETLSGLAHAHIKGILHRDIKPSNILIDEENNVKIIDFGISKLNDSMFTEYTLNFLGTRKYASPEQMRMEDLDQRSDIYSICYVITELLLSKDIRENIILEVKNSGLDEHIKDLLIKGLDENKENRINNISDLITGFKKAISNEINLYANEYAIGFTNKVINKMFTEGLILNESRNEAATLISKDLNQEYILMNYSRNQKRKDSYSYSIYGKQYEYLCVIDDKSKDKFTILDIKFFTQSSIHEDNKELAIRIDRSFQVFSYSDENFDVYDDINELIEEFEANYNKSNSKAQKEKEEKSITSKWSTAISLKKKLLDKKKNTLRYINFEVNEDGDRIVVTLKDKDIEKAFSDDQLLTMTSANNINREFNVGYCVEFSEGKLLIQLSRDVYPEQFAKSGEISINERMEEVSLNRQERALKAIRFKETANPFIPDIIMNPSLANVSPLVPEIEFKSKLDNSKENAVLKALQSEDIFLLQGPPGTGKTTFIGELVYQIISKNPESKILISSQSNVAVDHALNKIQSILPGISMLRIGRKDRLSQGAEQYLIEEQLDLMINNIKEKSKLFLEQIKNEVNLSPSTLDKYEKISLIDKINDMIKNLNNEIIENEMKLQSVKEKYNKIIVLTEGLNEVYSKLSSKIQFVNERELTGILNNFKEEYLNLGLRIVNEIDSANEIGEEKQMLEDIVMELTSKKLKNQTEIDVLKEQLKVENPEAFISLKSMIQQEMNDKKALIDEVTNIEIIQKEWISRVSVDNKFESLLIQKANIIGATCLGVSSLQSLNDISFDWVIVDEAGRATAPELLVPIVMAKKVVLVGDHKQLPPVIDEGYSELNLKEHNINIKDLEKSLFEELLTSINADCVGLLKEQYRMHKGIGDLISYVFYDNQLESPANIEDKQHGFTRWNGKSLVWLSTSEHPRKAQQELKNRGHITYENKLEVDIIFEKLVEMDNDYNGRGLFKEVGIIAGYQAQKSALRRKLEREYKDKFKNISVEINTVDAFQGRETDVIFYSIVRSNSKGQIGFLKDARRLNVALSRAKELLVIVGDHSSVTQEKILSGNVENPFVKVYEYMQENNQYCILEGV